jgi:hypothetical protein
MREMPGEARYIVTAPLIVVRCAPDGEFHHLYRGAHVPATVDPPQLDMLLSSGMITRRDDQ